MSLLGRIRPWVRRQLFGKPSFATTDVQIGQGVTFGENVVFNCKKVRIGDGVAFHGNTTIEAESFEIGDFGTIYPGCFFPGPGELKIGHNFWLGQQSIVDSMGGTTIADNVGVGAHSQLWTHMIFGDVMIGCKFHQVKPLVIDSDAWLVGHCLVSPVRIGERSVAMLGSVVTRDLQAEHVYAGVPAKDVTEKFGNPYNVSSIEQRKQYFELEYKKFLGKFGLSEAQAPFKAAVDSTDFQKVPDHVTVFDLSNRTYRKRGTEIERRFIRFLLPEAKFVPIQ